MATFYVTDTDNNSVFSLQNAINQANILDGDDTIDFSLVSGTITLESLLPKITSNIAFVGNGDDTISGDNQYRVFWVESGIVSFSNLNITNGYAKGGNGGFRSGGGGAGLGGGLFINDATVTIDAVSFSGNQAIGGNGGSGGKSKNDEIGFGGGGGGMGSDGSDQIPGFGSFDRGKGNGGGDGYINSGGSGNARLVYIRPDGSIGDYSEFRVGSGKLTFIDESSGGFGGGGRGGNGSFGNGGFGGGGGGTGGGKFGRGGFGGGGGGGRVDGSSGGSFGGNGGKGNSFDAIVGFEATINEYFGGGGGGAGLGGGIFVNAGNLKLTNTSFKNNSALGGVGGTGDSTATSGSNGQGKGGAIFINAINSPLVTVDNTVSNLLVFENDIVVQGTSQLSSNSPDMMKTDIITQADNMPTLSGVNTIALASNPLFI